MTHVETQDRQAHEPCERECVAQFVARADWEQLVRECSAAYAATESGVLYRDRRSACAP